MDNMAERHIEEALAYENNGIIKNDAGWKKAAAIFVIPMLGISAAGAVTMVADAGIRNVVIRFFTGFTDEEKEKLTDGHKPETLDPEIALLEFLHQYQDENNQLKYDDDGFDYTFIDKNKMNEKIVVSCNTEKEYLLVELSGSDIGGGVIAWKVGAYSLIPSAQAENLMHGNADNNSGYDKNETGLSKGNKPSGSETEESPEELHKNPADTVIKAEGKKGKIYDALNKEYIVTLTEEETDMLEEIFSRYQKDTEEGCGII